MQKYYDLFFSVTSRHKNRQKNDMQPEFSYFHWLKEAAKSKNLKVDPEKYKYEIMGGGPVAYISYSNNMEKNRPVLERHKTSTKTKVVFFPNPIWPYGPPTSVSFRSVKPPRTVHFDQ